MTNPSKLLSACHSAICGLDLMAAREHLTAYRDARQAKADEPFPSPSTGAMCGDDYANLLAERIEAARRSLLPSRLTLPILSTSMRASTRPSSIVRLR